MHVYVAVIFHSLILASNSKNIEGLIKTKYNMINPLFLIYWITTASTIENIIFDHLHI